MRLPLASMLTVVLPTASRINVVLPQDQRFLTRMALSATTLYQGEACVAAAGGTMPNPLRYTGIA